VLCGARHITPVFNGMTILDIKDILEDLNITTALLGSTTVLSVCVNVLFMKLNKAHEDEIEYVRKKFDEVQAFLLGILYDDNR